MEKALCTKCNRPAEGEGQFCRWCDQLVVAPAGVLRATAARRLGACILDALLVWPTLVIGYIIWWLIVLGRGQTPGKQLLGIYASKARGDGTAIGWGSTFVREFVFKGIVFGLLGGLTFGVASVLDYLWALWDRDTQTLHDKLANTVVVRRATS